MVEPAGAGRRGGSWARATRGQAAAQLGARGRERATARRRGRGGGRRAGGPDRGDGGRAGRARAESDRLRDVIRERERELRGSRAEHPLRAGAAQRGRAGVDREDADRDSRPPGAPRPRRRPRAGARPDAPGGRRGRASGRRRDGRAAGGRASAGRAPAARWKRTRRSRVAPSRRRSRGAGSLAVAEPVAAVEPEPASRRPSTTSARGCWRRSSSSPGRRRRARRARTPGHSRHGRPIGRRWRSSRRWSSATRLARTASCAPSRSSASSPTLAMSCGRPREVGGRAGELAGARRELERQRLLNERAYARSTRFAPSWPGSVRSRPAEAAPRAPRRPVRSRPTS